MAPSNIEGPTTDRMNRTNAIALLITLAAWGWTILAGGGGLLLLIERGPWPLTNGWFALASGLCACPLLAMAARRAGRTLSPWVQFALALFFFVSGHVALWIEAL